MTLSKQRTATEVPISTVKQINPPSHNVAEERQEDLQKLPLSAVQVASVLDTMSDGFLFFDREWQLKSMNRQAERLTGKQNAAAAGQSVEVVFPAIAGHRIFQEIRQTKDNVSREFEYQEQAIPTWFKVHVHVLPHGSTVFLRDISAQKAALETVRESEQRFRSMADNAPVLIWIADRDKRPTYFNKGWLAFRGRTMTQEAGNGWQEGVHPADRAAYFVAYEEVFKTRAHFQKEYRLRRSDSEYRWMLVSAVPRFSPNGTFVGYIGSSVDITDRKEVEGRKDEFISIASHELKTPVTSIKVYTQLLERYLVKEGDPRGSSYVVHIAQQLDRLTSLIDELLDVSKIEAGKLALHQEEFDLAESVATTISEIQPIAPDHTLKLTAPPRVIVRADRYRMSQVIINLLTNAVKYSPPEAAVHITLTTTEEAAIVAVRDTGPGIASEHQAKIFERFYRVDGQKQQSYPGLGLGLYISAEIIARHGGKIWVDSKPGQGATFHFSIPRFPKVTP